MTVALPTWCSFCKHLKDKEVNSCTAFRRIPIDFSMGRSKHDHPIAKQGNTIVWELDTRKQAMFDDMQHYLP